MPLTKFEATNRQGGLLSFPMDDISLGYSVQEIGGLGPVKAILVSSSFAGRDGLQYQSARREGRNLTFKFGLEPDWVTTTVEELRDRLYDYFMPKTEVYLVFYRSDGLTVNITGRVETCEPDIFSQEPMMDVAITCFEPDFLAMAETHLTGSTTSGSAETIITYPGTSETGMVLTLNADRTLTDFTIYHTLPSGDLRQLDFSGSLVAGDVLTISTVKGDKGATLIHSGASSSVLYAISPQSTWLEFERGINKIHVYAEGAAVPYTLDYLVKYGGL